MDVWGAVIWPPTGGKLSSGHLGLAQFQADFELVATSVHPWEASLHTSTPLTGHCMVSGWQLPVGLTPLQPVAAGPWEEAPSPCPATDPAPLTSC